MINIKSRYRKLIRIFAYFFLAVLFIDLAGVTFFYIHCKEYAEPIDRKFDAAVVFFHSVDENRSISSETEKRLKHALVLYSNKQIDNIICVGGWNAQNSYQGSKLMKNYLIEHSVPDSLITNDSLSYSSITNWVEARKIISEKNYENIILISSPTHIPRLVYISKDSNMNISASTFKPDYSLIRIWKDSNVEFLKWFAMLYLPGSITEKIRHFINKLPL